MEEEARRRDEEERARQQQKLDQLQEDMEGMSRKTPPTPEELEAIHQRLFPQFLKNAARFNATSTEIASYASRPALDPHALKDIRRKAKSLETEVDEMVDFLLDGEEAPDPPEVDYASHPLPDKLSLLSSMAPSIQQRIKNSYANRKSTIINAKEAVTLLRDLQSMKLLSHSLRQ